MNLYPSQRPRTISEVLDAAFQVFKVTFLKGLFYGVLAMLAGQTQNIYDVATGRPLQQFGGGDARWWVFYVLGACVSLMMWSALLIRQSAILEGRPVSLRSELGLAARRLPAVVVAVIVGIAAIALGTVLLVVPGIYLLVGLSFIVPAILFSGKGPIAGSKYSLQLVRNNWIRSFTVYAVGLSALLVFYLLAFTLVAVLLPFAGAGDVAVVTAFSAVVVVILGAVGAPFICGLIIALYADLQERHLPPA